MPNWRKPSKIKALLSKISVAASHPFPYSVCTGSCQSRVYKKGRMQMTQRELLNLIHQTVWDTFCFYEAETIKTFNALLNPAQPYTPEQSKALQTALFNYTMATSETICIAMSKVLLSAGLLNIQEANDEILRFSFPQFYLHRPLFCRKRSVSSSPYS